MLIEAREANRSIPNLSQDAQVLVQPKNVVIPQYGLALAPGGTTAQIDPGTLRFVNGNNWAEIYLDSTSDLRVRFEDGTNYVLATD